MPLRRSAFTLIELLVVITILTVLISLLLPGLRQARQAAKSAICRANLRSCATAAHAYATDRQGQFPFVAWRNGDGWPANEVPHAGAPISDYNLPWSNYAWDYLGRDREVLKCPVGLEVSSHPQIVVDPTAQERRDYPINAHIVGFGGAAFSVSMPSTRVGDVRRPAYNFLFAEGAFIALENYRDYPWMMGRHQSRMNAAHVDGHVADYFRDDYDYSDNQMPGGNMGVADYSNQPDRLHDNNTVWHMGPNGVVPPWPNGGPYPG